MVQHVDITDPYIHEPKGISSAAENTVYKSDGEGSGSWVSVVTSSDATLTPLLVTNNTTTQGPTATDTAYTVVFGGAASSTGGEVTDDGSGLITFTDVGLYRVAYSFQFGRSGASGVSHIYSRFLLNGVQSGASTLTKIDSADTLIPFIGAIELSITAANTTLQFQFYRDSAGNNSGDLIADSPTLSGWADSDSARLTISRVGVTVE